ncbi:MAG: hypothetical protein KGS72_16930 [Cyanobacteria bacterium REEB67]|nr:hypothetical protein [Cyanobacteria bacterium REEB67]
MKKINTTGSGGVKPRTEKAIPDPIYTDLLDKAMQSAGDEELDEDEVKQQPELLELDQSCDKASADKKAL